MSEENKTLELNDEELDQVVGGRTSAQGGDFQVNDWVGYANSRGLSSEVYYVTEKNGYKFSGYCYSRQSMYEALCLGLHTGVSALPFIKIDKPTWVPDLPNQ